MYTPDALPVTATEKEEQNLVDVVAFTTWQIISSDCYKKLPHAKITKVTDV